MRRHAAGALWIFGFMTLHVQLLGQLTPDEPDKQEIQRAYQSKKGEMRTPIPGLGSERWGINEIRGWSLKFKRVHEDTALGVLTRRYQAVAQKAGTCAEYEVIERRPLMPNPQIQPSLVVKTLGVKLCQ